MRILLPKPTMVCLLFVFWLLGFSTTGFVIKIVFTIILELTFITFIIYFILKLYIFINVFIQNLANGNVLGMSCICSLGFYRCLYFTVLCFLPLYHWWVFFLIYYMFFGILSIYFKFYFHVQFVLMLMLTKI